MYDFIEAKIKVYEFCKIGWDVVNVKAVSVNKYCAEIIVNRLKVFNTIWVELLLIKMNLIIVIVITVTTIQIILFKTVESYHGYYC